MLKSAIQSVYECFDKLSSRKKSLFLMLLCERGIRDYFAFATDNNIESIWAERMLDDAWAYVKTNDTHLDWQQCIEACEELAPFADEYPPHPLGTAAEYAIAELADTIAFLQSPEEKYAVGAMQTHFASIHSKVIAGEMGASDEPISDSISVDLENSEEIIKEKKMATYLVKLIDNLPSYFDANDVASIMIEAMKQN